MNPASIGASLGGTRRSARVRRLRIALAALRGGAANIPVVAALALVGAALSLTSTASAAAGQPAAASRTAGADGPSDAAASGIFDRPTTLPYAREYPAIPYTQRPTDNAIARLQARIDRGEVRLAFHRPRGYLDSILAALGIDPSSQTLVYSKTSLQTGDISAATPRAIYFNDDTYVAWVQGGDLELAAMDGKLGQVFYTLPNQPAQTVRLARKTVDCLSCHDTYELSGSGVPRFLLMSTYVDVHGNMLSHEGQILTFDQTPLKYRWGGWYVTGRSGDQVHLGNIQVHSIQQLVHLDQVRRGNLDTLKGLFDTSPYLTDKSDIVALLVLQHQVDVQNLITRINFEVRTALGKAGHGGGAAAPDSLPEETRAKLKGYMDTLVSTMLFVGATRFTSPISGNSGFTKRFESRGPRDAEGRSLRDFDLKTRLFKYPVSYLIYTPSFDALPNYARDYIYGRLADYLLGRDESVGRIETDPADVGETAQAAGDAAPQISAADRKATLDVLVATKPAFAHYLDTHGGRVAAQ